MSLPSPDFLRPTRGTSAAAWLFVGTAALVLAVSASEAWQAWDERAGVMAGVDVLRTPAEPSASRASPENAALVAVAQLLDAPWQRRFQAVESATSPGLGWLSVDLGHRGELQLVGVSPSGSGALGAAERLRASGAWRDVVVSRIEQGAGGVQRFEIRATVERGR